MWSKNPSSASAFACRTRESPLGHADKNLDYHEVVHVFTEDRMRAAELYFKLGRLVRATIRQLGYPIEERPEGLVTDSAFGTRMKNQRTNLHARCRGRRACAAARTAVAAAAAGSARNLLRRELYAKPVHRCIRGRGEPAGDMRLRRAIAARKQTPRCEPQAPRKDQRDRHGLENRVAHDSALAI